MIDCPSISKLLQLTSVLGVERVFFLKPDDAVKVIERHQAIQNGES
jgi:hypothetical protein